MDYEIVCNILNFLMGMLTMYLLRVGWVKYHDKRGVTPPSLRFSRRTAISVGVSIVVIGALFTGIQSYQTDRAVYGLTIETQRCYREFSEALRARAIISLENDQLSRKQRDALADLLAGISNPPPHVMASPPDSQLRRDYNRQVIATSYEIIQQARQRQGELDEERKQHPLPEPTCGME